jgi:hypothetical protein
MRETRIHRKTTADGFAQRYGELVRGLQKLIDSLR